MYKSWKLPYTFTGTTQTSYAVIHVFTQGHTWDIYPLVVHMYIRLIWFENTAGVYSIHVHLHLHVYIHVVSPWPLGSTSTTSCRPVAIPTCTSSHIHIAYALCEYTHHFSAQPVNVYLVKVWNWQINSFAILWTNQCETANRMFSIRTHIS